MAKKRVKKLSELSFSDSELNMIDWDASLQRHSHFFAPSGRPHNRYSTPLIVISTGPANTERSYGSGGGVNATQSSDGSNGAPSPGPVSPRPFPHSTSRSKLIVAPHNGHGEDRHTVNGSTTRNTSAWPTGRLYVNKDSLAHDLSFLANKPELCDVTFLVGEDRQPICAVRAILAARSR